MDLSSLIDDTPLSSAQIVGTADTLLTDATDAILRGNDPVLANNQAAGGDATGLLDGLGSDAAQGSGVNPALLGAVGAVVPGTQALSAQPVEPLANNAILDFHATLETLGHDLRVADGFHGLTNLGETVGLGYIGGPNLVSDVLATPTALVSGDLTPVSHIPADLANIDAAAQTFVSYLALDAAHLGDVLSDPVGNLESAIPTLEAFPASALANEAVDTVHGFLETVLDPIIPNTTHGLIGTGNALGLGALNGQNASTDVLHAPTALLSGDTSPLTHLTGDLGQVGTAIGGLLGGVGGDLAGSSLLGALTHPTSGGGILGGTLPGAGVVGTATGLVDGAVNGLGDATGLGGITHAVTGAAGVIGGGSSSPVTGLLHVPGDILGGVSNGASPLPGDGGASLGTLGSVVGAVASEVGQLGGGASPLAPVTGALSGGTGGVLGTVTGALGGVGSGSGSHDLLTVTAGPQTPTSGLGINVLDTTSGGQTHLVDTSVGSAGAPAPTIGTIALLPDSIHLPPAATGGSDALSGVLQSVTGGGTSASAGASSSAGLDLGIVHIDAPIAVAHADPLGALGLAAHHA